MEGYYSGCNGYNGYDNGYAGCNERWWLDSDLDLHGDLHLERDKTTQAVKKSFPTLIKEKEPDRMADRPVFTNNLLQWLQWLQWGVTFSQVVWLIGCWLVSASHK